MKAYKKSDVFLLKKVVKTEFNIEGFPSKDFIDLVLKVQPNQVTLVLTPQIFYQMLDGILSKLIFLKKL